MLEKRMQHQPDQTDLYKISFLLRAGKFWSLYIYSCTSSLKSYFGHMGETLVWSTWLCSAHPPLQATSSPLSVTSASVHFEGISKYGVLIWSLILFWKWDIHSRNVLAAFPPDVEEFCFLADSRNYPELPFSILVGYFLKFWCCRLSDTMWVTPQTVIGVHHTWTSMRFNSKAFPNTQKYAFVLFRHGCWILQELQIPPFWLMHIYKCVTWKHKCLSTQTWAVSNEAMTSPHMVQGAAGSTRTHSSQRQSRNKQEILGLLDIFSAAWNGCESKQKETVGKL